MPSLALEDLFNPEPGAPSFFYAILGVLYLLLLLASIFVLRYRARLLAGNRLLEGLANTAATIGTVLGASGVALVALRYLQVPILSARILIYVLVLASLVLLGYAAYYFWKLLPARLARYQAEELRRRYMPRPKPRPGGVPSRLAHSHKKGKKHR